jgi:hypothetical protein
VVVLPDRAVRREDVDPALPGLGGLAVVEALLRVRDAQLERRLLLRPRPLAVELDGRQRLVRGGQGRRRDGRGGAGDQRRGERRQHGDETACGTESVHKYLGVRFGKVLRDGGRESLWPG